jgi:adenine-specific DNA-methyltransferase
MPILQWLDRDKTLTVVQNIPYRMLSELKEYSYGDPQTQNMIVQGDNLEALKALLPYYAGQVKCIYIDPPYNTKSAFEHYDDNLEHSQWLHMMYPRLELLREFLREDGSIWVSIDDNEGHYLKVIMDEVFGRKNFIANVIWQKVFSPKNTAKHFSDDHDYITVYAKSINLFNVNQMPRSEKQNKGYKNPDNDPRGSWTSGDLSARNPYSLGIYSVTCPSGRVINGPPPGTYWRVSKEKMVALDADKRIWWGKDGNGVPRLKRYLSEVSQGIIPQTLWHHEDVGHTQDAKKEIVSLFDDDIFGTPKPEKLIRRIIHIATNPSDLVIDSFLGSGTTAAVAQKMGRRYIGIEMGDHAITHVVPRLQKVIDGEQGGISKTVNWQGGGGFRFYRLGETVFDENGQLNPGVHFSALAAHIWFCETGFPYQGNADSPLLGIYEGIAYYLLYNGILGDKRPDSGNVLTHKILSVLPSHEGAKVIYGEASRLGETRLRELGITFKQTPYDVKIR